MIYNNMDPIKSKYQTFREHLNNYLNFKENFLFFMQNNTFAPK